MDASFLADRITATKQQIIDLEGAFTSLTADAQGIESYTFDSGQGRVTVTRANISSLSKAIDSLYNRLSILEYRLNGGNSTQARPGW